MVVRFSDVQGGWAGEGNINADPRFDAAWHLKAGSPCLDAGDGNIASQKDAEGKPRFDDPNVVNTGVGNPDFTDLGAYERQGRQADSGIGFRVDGVSPAEATGGTLVLVRGTGFKSSGSAPVVTFGGIPSDQVTVLDDTTLIAVAPPNVSGKVDIRLVSPTAASTPIRAAGTPYEEPE